MTEKVKLLYIAGTGRNGSTLLERLLNQVPGIFAAGELGRIKRYNKKEMCFCGQTFKECAVWQPIVEEVNSKINHTHFTQADSKYHKLSGWAFWKLRTLQKRHQLPEDLQAYIRDLEVWYQAIAHHQHCQVITDSTIDLPYGYYLSLIPSIDFYVLHLVRDPRGVAYSWHRQKFLSSSETSWTPQRQHWQTAVSWNKRNLFIQSSLWGIYPKAQLI